MGSTFLNLLLNHAWNIDLFTENINLILVWTSVSTHYRDLPDKYEERVCGAVGAALVDLPKPLAHHCKIVMLYLLFFSLMHGVLSLPATLSVTLIACEDYENATTYKFNDKTFEVR